jgi:acyl-CoA reductase-like NAD-dependent aldehyde dehydrogenase
MCAVLLLWKLQSHVQRQKLKVARTMMTYKLAAEEARFIHGETIPMDATLDGEERIAFTIRHPLGVIAAILRLNFR